MTLGADEMQTKESYDKDYLPAAQENLGLMFDAAINLFDVPSEKYMNLFLQSPLSKRFGEGDPFVVWGKSGIEITFDILGKNREDYLKALEEKGKEGLSKEYWAGWALAYYQWKSGKTFQEINDKVPFTSIINMYHPYHEMDILQFCDRMEEL